MRTRAALFVLGCAVGATACAAREGSFSPAPIVIERSLVWVDPILVDDPAVAGLRRVMGAMSGHVRAGALFAAWFRRFATTAHSERAFPAQLVDEIAASRGADPAGWDLDAVGFKTTGIHNRIDLGRGVDCGELRVSMSSTVPHIQPLHLIFNFRQVPGAGDIDEPGRVHCRATARRYASLSGLDDASFRREARRLLDEHLVPERFIIAESVENTVSPWEWRQWVLVPNANPETREALPFVLDNPPLFQQVDVETLNTLGPLRERFLTFLSSNAAALDARTLLIPEEFRARSARVTQGVPRTPLSLDGLAPSLTERFPALRQQIEIVGCAACHTADAEFVQTRIDRTFSPFYEKELRARAALLADLAAGRFRSAPFGPLQASPVLPP